MTPERPLYFPVLAGPLRMQPGLFRFGTDFGNAEADRQFFPRDATSPHYLAEKARVLALEPGCSGFSVHGTEDAACVDAAEGWFRESLAQQGLALPPELPRSEWGSELVEDFAVLRRDDTGADRVLWLQACFPSGWRPEYVLGRSFAQIHAHIPAFDAMLRKTASLVDAMVTHGPYVRFVWTVSADDELDHHPERGRRDAWSATTQRGFLRVERQTTVPLPDVSGCVFLIRTYLYDFRELPAEKRQVLAQALAQMPPEIAAYKGLNGALPRALELLR